MKSIEIKGKLREKIGKSNSRKLRSQGNVPCVIYGEGENIHFYAHENDFRKMIYSPNVFRVKLDIEGKKYEAVLQDIQFHPVTDSILHIDFYQIREDKPVTVNVPVQFSGVAEGVKEGGKLLCEMRWMKVRGLPNHLPDMIDLDVTGLKLGNSIKIGDLDYSNLELMHSKNSVVASVKLTRVSKGALPEEEEAEAEAEAEAAAEGEGEEAGESGEGSGTEGGEEDKS